MEFMRRMKDMSQLGGPMSFYGELPNQYNVVINSNHPLVSRIHEEKEKKCRKELDKYNEKLKPIEDNKANWTKPIRIKKRKKLPRLIKTGLLNWRRRSRNSRINGRKY